MKHKSGMLQPFLLMKVNWAGTSVGNHPLSRISCDKWAYFITFFPLEFWILSELLLFKDSPSSGSRFGISPVLALKSPITTRLFVGSLSVFEQMSLKFSSPSLVGARYVQIIFILVILTMM